MNIGHYALEYGHIRQLYPLNPNKANNRHDVWRWFRQVFKPAALVAQDALLLEKRVEALTILVQVIDLNSAIILTGSFYKQVLPFHGTVQGRRWNVTSPNIQQVPRERPMVVNRAINYQIQSSAADIDLSARRRVQQLMTLDTEALRSIQASLLTHDGAASAAELLVTSRVSYRESNTRPRSYNALALRYERLLSGPVFSSQNYMRIHAKLSNFAIAHTP